MVGFRWKWLAGLLVGAVLTVSPSVASASLIHSALYDWFDIDGDLQIDYVRVAQTAPFVDVFVFDMNLNVVVPEENLNDFTPLVEVLQKFFDGPQGKDLVNPDFEWTVLHDSSDILPHFESFHIFHDVGGFAIPNATTGVTGGNSLGWDFSQTGTSLDWNAGDGDPLINGEVGEFRASVRPFISWEYGFAAVDWTDPETGEKVFIYGITSVPTPEPTTLLLAGMALPFGVLGYRRRQRLAKNA